MQNLAVGKKLSMKTSHMYSKVPLPGDGLAAVNLLYNPSSPPFFLLFSHYLKLLSFFLSHLIPPNIISFMLLLYLLHIFTINLHVCIFIFPVPYRHIIDEMVPPSCNFSQVAHTIAHGVPIVCTRCPYSLQGPPPW